LGDFPVFERNGELEIELAQLEVIGHHVAHQRSVHAAAALFARQVLGPRSFRQAAKAAPEIELPTQAESGLRVTDVAEDTGGRGQLELAGLRVSGGDKAAVRIQCSELRRAVNAEPGPGFQDSLGRNPQIEVLLQGGRYELLQLVVLKKIEPLQVGQRCYSRGLVRIAHAAKLRRDLHRRPPVLRTDGAG